MKIKEICKKIVEKYDLKRENVIPALISASITAVFFIDSSFLHNNLLKGLWIIIGILLGLMVLAIMMLAGYAMFRSLVEISAALTFFIFIAQTYCGLPAHTQNGVDALKTLFGIAILCMGYDLIKSLIKVCRVIEKKLKGDHEKWPWQGKVAIGFFFLFIVYFLYSLYQVIAPIFFSLCIY